MIIATCKKHPKYQAMRKPKAECKACGFLWNLFRNSPKPAIKIVLASEMEKGLVLRFWFPEIDK